MDDVLVCVPTQRYLDWTLGEVIRALEAERFEIHPKKVQKTSSFKYLGQKIEEQKVVPQPLKINDNPKTLQELHQLCESINWVR